MFTNRKLLGNHHFHPYNNCFLGVPGKWTFNPGCGSWFCFSPSKRYHGISETDSKKSKVQNMRYLRWYLHFVGEWGVTIGREKHTLLGQPQLGFRVLFGMLKNSQYQESAGLYTLQGINISHLGKRKIIFKMLFLGDMLVPWRVAFRDSCTHKKLEEREHPGGCCDQEHPQTHPRQMDHRFEGPLNDDQWYVLLGIQITA